jgi:hypothetical protein
MLTSGRLRDDEIFGNHRSKSLRASRAVCTNILFSCASCRHVRGRSPALHRPRGVERREGTADDHVHADHGSLAARETGNRGGTSRSAGPGSGTKLLLVPTPLPLSDENSRGKVQNVCGDSSDYFLGINFFPEEAKPDLFGSDSSRPPFTGTPISIPAPTTDE